MALAVSQTENKRMHKIRIRLRSSRRPASLPRPPVPANKTPKSSTKERSRQYRETIRRDPARYEQYLTEAAYRSKLYRDNLSDDKRKASNEKAKLRVQKYRERLKQKRAPLAEASVVGRPVTRAEEEKKKSQQRKWRDAKRLHRANMSSQKKRRVNERRRKNYHAKKAAEQGRNIQQLQEARSPSLPIPHVARPRESPEQSSEMRTASAQRKALQRARAGLPRTPDRFASTVEKLLTSCSPAKRNALKRRRLHFGKDIRVQEKLSEVISGKIEQVKNSQRKHDRQLNSTLLSSIVVLKKYSLLRTASTVLGVNWKRFMKVQKHKTHRPHKAALPRATVNAVRSFYEDQSTTLPYKKAVSKKSGIANAFLDRTVNDLYHEFKAEHPTLRIGLTRFSQLRPKHVKLAKDQKLDQCLCEICTNATQKLKALNKLADSVNLQNRKINSVYDAVKIVVCEKEQGEKFYKKDCLERSCESCSGYSLKDHFADLVGQLGGDKQVSWQQWDSVVTGNGSSKQTRKALLSRTGSVTMLVDEVSKMMDFLAKHLHVAAWQQQQFVEMKRNLPQGWVLMVLDFGENYSCEHQDEVQSAHWYHDQCTVHPIVSYYLCPNCPETVTESLVFLSSDRKHDHHAVNHFVTLANAHLKQERNLQISKEVHFTDGCGAQYKSKYAFNTISKAPSTFGFVIERSFFGSRHGKGPSDGETAVIKSQASAAVRARRAVIRNAEELYNYCDANLTRKPAATDGSCPPNHFFRTFFWVPEGDVLHEPQQLQVGTVHGTRQLHCVRSVGDGVIQTRNLSCYCHSCISSHGENCINTSHLEPWVERKLKVTISQNGSHTGESEDETCDVNAPSDDSTDVSELAERLNKSDSFFEDALKDCEDTLELPSDATCSGTILVEAEKYYAVDFVFKFYIGRILKKIEGKWRVKFLHSYCKDGKTYYKWPLSDDVEDVYPATIFAGPLELSGVDPFTLPNLTEIQRIFQDTR